MHNQDELPQPLSQHNYNFKIEDQEFAAEAIETPWAYGVPAHNSDTYTPDHELQEEPYIPHHYPRHTRRAMMLRTRKNWYNLFFWNALHTCDMEQKLWPGQESKTWYSIRAEEFRTTEKVITSIQFGDPDDGGARNQKTTVRAIRQTVHYTNPTWTGAADLPHLYKYLFRVTSDTTQMLACITQLITQGSAWILSYERAPIHIQIQHPFDVPSELIKAAQKAFQKLTKSEAIHAQNKAARRINGHNWLQK